MLTTPDMVDEGLWVGPAPRTDGDFRRLAALGVQEVLSLQPEEEARAIGVPPEDAARMAATHGLALHRVPIRDFDVRSMASGVPGAVRLLRDLRARGRQVYVHCNAGINRAPTVAAGYLALAHDLTGAQACEWITAAHPCAPDRHVVGTIAGR